MELGTFTPRPPMENGDQFSAKEAVDRPLIALVREHRTGIKTKFNSIPGEKGYKADGGEGITVDVADIRTNEVWIDVLWMNGAVVDNLASYVGQTVPVKLVWQASAKGGNAYITVIPLEGPELALAQQWAAANTNRFETERANRAAQAVASPAPTPASTTLQPSPPASVPAQQAPTPADPTQDPQVLALIAQLQTQQKVS